MKLITKFGTNAIFDSQKRNIKTSVLEQIAKDTKKQPEAIPSCFARSGSIALLDLEFVANFQTMGDLNYQ